jgi:hypothetical protein
MLSPPEVATSFEVDDAELNAMNEGMTRLDEVLVASESAISPAEEHATLVTAGKLHRHLAVDSDAVVSPVLPMIKIATKLLASPLAVWFGVALGVGASAAHLAEPYTTALNILFVVGVSVGSLLASLTLFSLRRVTRDDGQLRTLGVGTTKISTKAATSLGRWHVGLIVLSALMVLLGLKAAVSNGLLGNEGLTKSSQFQPGEEELTAQQRLFMSLFGLFIIYVWSLAISTWWLSLKVASVLVSDQVIEVAKLIDKISATSAEWEALVVPELLTLIKKTLPALSKGWADGLLAISAGCWLYGLSTFTAFIDDRSALILCLTVFFACLPLFLAWDVASASSDCNTIKKTLNDKRAASKYDLDVDAKLTVMETHLANLSSGAGLGFIVAGKVVDKTTIKTIFVQMFVLLSTVVPLILALQPKAIVAGTNTCAATAAQTALVRATFTNSSCSYAHVSIGSLLLN